MIKQLRLDRTGYVKWDREKVAKELYFEGEHFEDGSIAMETWVHGNPKRLEPFYKRADQLKEILTGGE